MCKDPVLFMCMEKLFEWANEVGLKGQKVSNLRMIDPDLNNPIDGYYKIFCNIECTEEQRITWEKQRIDDMDSYLKIFCNTQDTTEEQE